MKNTKHNKTKNAILIGFAGIMFLMMSANVFSAPLGANIIQSGSTRKAIPNATDLYAQGGNTTWINADLSQVTNVWQGFFGVVTGGILLEDGNSNRFYDWDVVSATGEIFATRNVVADWTEVNCTNQTEIYLEEERLTIQNASSDGINDTFTSTAHPDFDVAGKYLSGCRATRTYNSTDSQSIFWNVLLNTNATNTVYTVLMENDRIGFNGTAVDFQLLVPVDRLTGYSTYLIYVEMS